MTVRRVLPNRRQGAAFVFSHDGIDYHATVNRFEDGSIAELFLNAGKEGSAVNIVAHDAAVVCSIALQLGTPIDVLRGALAKLENGTHAGPVGVALDLAEGGNP